MHSLIRTVLLALVAAASLAIATGTAAAALTPDPYSTSTGTGSYTIRTTLGIGTCRLGALRGQLRGTAGGATGTFTGFTATGCSGVITAAEYSEPLSFTVNQGVVAVVFGVLMTNIYGGRCVYRGTMRGTTPQSATSFTVAGNLALVRTVSGVCEYPQDAHVTLSLPGQSIMWPAPPPTGLRPDPYSTAAGTGILGLHTVYGSAGCELSGVAINATGIAYGARGTITGFTASNCYGVYTRASFNQAMVFSAASGVASVSMNAQLTNVFGGTCIYSGTLTGTVPNGGYVLTVRGDLALTRTVSGYCETPQTATVGVALPGATISW